MNKEEIKKILPHREPMLLVDEVELIDGKAHGKCHIKGDEFFLQGHFPGNPVLPGVCTLQIVRECLERGTGRRHRFTAIRECKFLGMIVPQADTLLDIDIRLADDGTAAKKVTCVVTNNEKTVLKLKATATPKA